MKQKTCCIYKEKRNSIQFNSSHHYKTYNDDLQQEEEPLEAESTESL